MEHTFSPMLEAQSESDFNVHDNARIQIQNRGGSGWLQLINVMNVNCPVNQWNEEDGSTEFIILFTEYRL